MSVKLSREKINYLSRIIMESIFEDEQVEFQEEPNEIRLSIVKSIENELKLYELLEQKSIDKIDSQKKTIKEGSREWEILFRKYYKDEVSKLGKSF
ncbi:MAG: DUF507 family protein [Candidatus Aminicenantes bacterium]|nr:DUF507 family protein [Candidatus Aminicenantes bacterium]